MADLWTYEERLRSGQILSELAEKAGKKGINCEDAYHKVAEIMDMEIPLNERRSVTFFAKVKREGGYNKSARFFYNPDKTIPNEGTVLSNEDEDDSGDEGESTQFQNPSATPSYAAPTGPSAPQAVLDDEEYQDWVEISGNLRVNVTSLDPDDDSELTLRAKQVWIKKQPRK